MQVRLESKNKADASQDTALRSTLTGHVGDHVRTSRAAIVAAAVLVGAVGKVAFLYWHTPYDKGAVVPYDTFRSIRDGWYISHYFGGTVMGLGFIALALAACLLVRGAGSTWTTIGATLTGLGGLLIAPGLAGEGVSYSYASDPAALPKPYGAVLLRYMFQHPDRTLVFLLVGLGLITIGGVLLGIGLLRARVAPIWVPVALIVGSLLLPTTPHAITWWASLPGTAAAIAVGWYAWNGARRTAPAAV
ncbi:MAG: hypothetical protein NVS3B26_19650 [Mycobacteriales bacterium]